MAISLPAPAAIWHHSRQWAAQLALWAARRAGAVSGVVATLDHRLAPWRRQFALWQERVERRTRLARLEPQQLAEQGLSRAQLMNELAKPFWRP